MYWVEISPTTKHTIPTRLVPESEMLNHTGFHSVYAYPQETVDWIGKNYSEQWKVYGSVVGLAASRMPVYSDMLYIDFDVNPEPDARKFCAFLRQHNIQYSVWSSGGRSYHVHVHCLPKCDYRIPESQKHWVTGIMEMLNITMDTSIYHAAGLYRLPGTLHHKTNQPKECIDFTEGTLLDYELVESSTPLTPKTTAPEVLASLWRLLLAHIDAGGRQLHIYKICTQAMKLGWHVDKTLKHVEYWNNRQPNPLPQEIADDKVYSTYRSYR